jgi:NMD protein affecting ribosome stability and mRNA decay
MPAGAAAYRAPHTFTDEVDMKAERGAFRMKRQEQRLVGLGKDPYEAGRKPRGATRCADCGALFYRGRWTWRGAPRVAAAGLCPACRRVRERLPAGFVRLRGPFVREHRDELLGRARRCEESERREHPLQRIMGVDSAAENLLITTTDPHLARRIGEALRDAYKGELRVRYSDDERLVRVYWTR